MRDKIRFFVIGAILATIAYLIGDLETLTAERGRVQGTMPMDTVTELDELRVNHLRVKDGIIVGDIGGKFIFITADNESAEIILSGGEFPKDYNGVLRTSNSPTLKLMADNINAVIKASSHHKRPEATFASGVSKGEGKFTSGLVLEDSNGKKSILSD